MSSAKWGESRSYLVQDLVLLTFSSMIAEEIDSGDPRIKMYEDDKGQFKGDALVVYFRPESVDLAVQMLDDTEFRLGSQGPNGNMRVQAADFSYKAQQEAPQKKNKKDQSKIIKKTQKMNNKLADWDDDDPQQLTETSSKWDKVVILKHMFTTQELEVSLASLTCATAVNSYTGRSICYPRHQGRYSRRVCQTWKHHQCDIVRPGARGRCQREIYRP
jgi:hypothetical protein